MSNNLKNTILIVGSGYMSREYVKVLTSMKMEIIVVGRGKEKILEMKKLFPKAKYYSGGLELFFQKNNYFPDKAINTSSIENLYETNLLLIENGIKKILVEKPGDLCIENLKLLNKFSKEKKVVIQIGYNRRFYENIIFFKNNIIKNEKILSAHFEFTEWVHKIDPKDYAKSSLSKWITSNSSHVIDTAFHLIGFPKKITTNVLLKNKINWHKSGSIFTGSGISIKNIPFTYHSNWASAGRWSIEILTDESRYYFRPMEKIFRQKIGTINLEEIELEYKFDSKFKPGLYNQTKSFLSSKYDFFVSLNEQIKMIDLYNKIGNY
tara:strand:- start:1375 stop:2340 length:966 start_codon:yes stop_codon:yes gene_type:complete